jgi:glutaredoxin-like protein
MDQQPPATSTAPASAALLPDAPIVMFWRQGCGFCAALDRSLQRLGVPFERVNIWDEPDAAAFVRSVARGNEVVPTVRIGSVALVNPSPAEVLAAARAQVPGAVTHVEG